MPCPPVQPSESRLPNPFRGRSVWLSGISGFKGSWLAEWLLDAGASVTGLSLPPPTRPSLFAQLDIASRLRCWHDADVCDLKSVKQSLQEARPDFVFHLAAQPLVRLSYEQPLETYQTNVLGTIHVMEALRHMNKPCAAVLITTDKVYENREWLHAYREEDPLGGYDPYSSSKAACEIAISSWRRSFFQNHPVKIAVARAGNVIGGGDWALDRIVPDCVRSLQKGEAIPVRNKTSTRPWQHVLEPLSGYLSLAASLADKEHAHGDKGDEGEAGEWTGNNGRPAPGSAQRSEAAVGPHPAAGIATFSSAASAASFNFGPDLNSNRTVAELVQEVLKHWPGNWEDRSDPDAPHEAGKLNLATDKAFHMLGWRPRWDFPVTVAKTVEWYRAVHEGASPRKITLQQIADYCAGAGYLNHWEPPKNNTSSL